MQFKYTTLARFLSIQIDELSVLLVPARPDWTRLDDRVRLRRQVIPFTRTHLARELLVVQEGFVCGNKYLGDDCTYTQTYVVIESQTNTNKKSYLLLIFVLPILWCLFYCNGILLITISLHDALTDKSALAFGW